MCHITRQPRNRVVSGRYRFFTNKMVKLIFNCVQVPSVRRQVGPINSAIPMVFEPKLQ